MEICWLMNIPRENLIKIENTVAERAREETLKKWNLLSNFALRDNKKEIRSRELSSAVTLVDPVVLVNRHMQSIEGFTAVDVCNVIALIENLPITFKNKGLAPHSIASASVFFYSKYCGIKIRAHAITKVFSSNNKTQRLLARNIEKLCRGARMPWEKEEGGAS